MTTLYNTDTPSKSFLKSELAQIVLGVSILFCCAQVTIPIQPIPITFQTVGIMLIGLCPSIVYPLLFRTMLIFQIFLIK